MTLENDKAGFFILSNLLKRLSCHLSGLISPLLGLLAEFIDFIHSFPAKPQLSHQRGFGMVGAKKCLYILSYVFALFATSPNWSHLSGWQIIRVSYIIVCAGVCGALSVCGCVRA